MSAISIVRVGEGSAKPITINDGKTVIGRGPFLQVTDKRVSRNHGVLEVSDGKLYLTPTHTNPCFFKKTSNSSVEIMKKDDRRMLENAQIFGLLPDSLYFKVQCPVTQNGTNKSKAKVVEEEAEHSEEETEPDMPEKPRPWQTVKTEDGKEMTIPLEKKRVLPSWMVQMAKTSPAVNKPVTTNRQIAKTPTKRKTNDDDFSPPKKKTPAKAGGGRRRKTESEEDEDYEVEEEEEPTKTSKRGSARKKYYVESEEQSDEDWEAEEEEYKPKKRSPAKPRHTPKAKPRPRRKARESSENESEEELPKKSKRGSKSRRVRATSEDEMPGTSRPTRAARSIRTSYVDDFVDFSDEEDLSKGMAKDDEDSDFVLEEVDDSASDWETKGSKSSQKKNQGTPSRRSSRTVGRRKKYANSDEESISEDEYVPRSTRKRQAGPAKRVGRRKRRSSSEEEESSSDDYVAPKRDPKTRKRKNHSESEEESEDEVPKKKTSPRKKKNVSDSEEEDKKDKRDEVKKVRQLKSKHRPPCMFGKKCYRKNPEHFTEFSHPGDVSYDEQSDLEDEDEKPDCPYGPTCYRTNTSHQKQYKHHVRKEITLAAPLPVSKKGKDDEESTGPNTYDYNDSFINDETQGHQSDEGASESGQDASEEDEEEEEDINALKKEAKKFVKNEKMTKPV